MVGMWRKDFIVGSIRYFVGGGGLYVGGCLWFVGCVCVGFVCVGM